MALSQALARLSLYGRNRATLLAPSPSSSLTSNDAPDYDMLPPEGPEGYTDLPPVYLLSMDSAYAQWRASCSAANALVDAEQAYKECCEEVETLKKELSELKLRSFERFKNLHPKRKSSVSMYLRKAVTKRKSPSASLSASVVTPRESGVAGLEVPNIDEPVAGDPTSPVESIVDFSVAIHEGLNELQLAFEQAHATEMLQTTKLEELELRAAQLKARRDELSLVSASQEETWIHLVQAAESRPPSSPAMASQLGAALEKLNATETGFGLAKAERMSLSRARQTIQHAHRYFSQALKISDELHGGPASTAPTETPGNNCHRNNANKLGLGIKLGRSGGGVFGNGFGATARVLDYQDSVRVAGIGQACLNECIRVLEPYSAAIPRDELLNDYEVLKKDGILQMVKVYNLVFGGTLINSGVRNSIVNALSKQEVAFASLTRLAVWVQSRVPECETAEEGARVRREEARTEIAELWMASG